MKSKIPYFVLLACIAGQFLLFYRGPLTVTQEDNATIYREQQIPLIALSSVMFGAGVWFAIRHLRTWGWRKTFLTDTEKWGPAQRDSATSLSLFGFGLAFLVLSVCGLFTDHYVKVSSEGFEERPDWLFGEQLPPHRVRFAGLVSIDFNYYQRSGRREYAYIRCVPRGSGDSAVLVPRSPLLRRAIPQIAGEARKAGLEIRND